jgi:hypothetical protein
MGQRPPPARRCWPRTRRGSVRRGFSRPGRIAGRAPRRCAPGDLIAACCWYNLKGNGVWYNRTVNTNRAQAARLVLIMSSVFALFMLAGFTSCSPQSWRPNCQQTKPKPNLQNPPIYHNAEALGTEETSSLGRPAQVISFTASSLPEEVIAFYRTELPKNGWELSNSQPPDGLDFFWTNHCLDASYTLSVTAKSRGANKTQVELVTSTYDSE